MKKWSLRTLREKLIKILTKFIRSDNGPEFIADAIEKWLKENHVKTSHIAPSSPWESGYIESFNSKLRDDVLNREVLHSDKETKVIVENWRLEYNNHRLHSSLDYMTPAAFVASCNLAVYVPPVGLRGKEYG